MSSDEGDSAERPAGNSLRLALLMLGLTAMGALAIGYVMRPAPPTRVLVLPRASTSTAPPSRPARPTRDELTYHADIYGQFYLDAEVNGTTIRFLVDTGASYLSLTPKDAAAIGLSPTRLDYNLRMSTARGPARAAQVQVREVRIGQLSVENVPAIVMEDPSRDSLLGMSFLSRLDGYQISNGVLTMAW